MSASLSKELETSGLFENSVKNELLESGKFVFRDRRLIKVNQNLYVIDEDNNRLLERYEFMLYLLAQNKLDGQLFIPKAIKFGTLHDHLVSDVAWVQKNKLLRGSVLDRMDT